MGTLFDVAVQRAGVRRSRLVAGSIHVRLVGVIAALLFALAAPSISAAATFGQARAELLAWHLNPPPLFPSQLPASHRAVNVHLYSFGSVQYVIDFGAPDNADCHTVPNPNAWCVQIRRLVGVSWLDSWLHGPDIYSLRSMRIGKRNVWFFGDAGNAGGWWMAWQEQGDTYGAWAWTDERTALQRLAPFVKSLQPLSIQAATSPNWSGYVSLKPPSKAPVSARVALPAVACTTSGRVSMWVGYDGWTSNTVEQDGVSAMCSHTGAQPSFHIWWELFKGSCFLSICYSRFYDIYERPVATSYALVAGDSVDLSVARLAPRPLGRDKITFRISAYDAHGRPLRGQWQKTVIEPLAYNAKYSSSECILEAPGTASGLAAMPNFGRADFANCSIIDDATSATDLRSVNMVRNRITLTKAEGVTVRDDFAVDWQASS